MGLQGWFLEEEGGREDNCVQREETFTVRRGTKNKIIKLLSVIRQRKCFFPLSRPQPVSLTRELYARVYIILYKGEMR